jgi:hypothetical protein
MSGVRWRVAGKSVFHARLEARLERGMASSAQRSNHAWMGSSDLAVNKYDSVDSETLV